MVWPNCLRLAAHSVAISKRPLGLAEAAGGNREARRRQPFVGDIEAVVDLAQHLTLGHPAVVEV